MIITEEIRKYLSGEEFSGGYKMKMENNALYSRLERIIMLTKGKNILHVGCCDHLPLIEEKIKHHRWLQGILEENCEEVIGIDINDEAVEFVNEKKLGKEQVYCVDITSPVFLEMMPKGKHFDMVLLGEIVEHLDNPVAFLERMKNNMDKYGFKGKYVITVPNAYVFLRDRNAHEGVECINSDHRFWFTPYTICKVMYQAGITPNEVFFAGDEWGGKRIERLCRKMFCSSGEPSAYESFKASYLIVTGI